MKTWFRGAFQKKRMGFVGTDHGRGRMVLIYPAAAPEVFYILKFFFSFKAAPVASGSFWSGGQITATGPGLHHSHSNSGVKLHL